jgi:hypothetical protein
MQGNTYQDVRNADNCSHEQYTTSRKGCQMIRFMVSSKDAATADGTAHTVQLSARKALTSGLTGKFATQTNKR